jgi:hypothetical protein
VDSIETSTHRSTKPTHRTLTEPTASAHLKLPLTFGCLTAIEQQPQGSLLPRSSLPASEISIRAHAVHPPVGSPRPHSFFILLDNPQIANCCATGFFPAPRKQTTSAQASFFQRAAFFSLQTGTREFEILRFQDTQLFASSLIRPSSSDLIHLPTNHPRQPPRFSIVTHAHRP